MQLILHDNTNLQRILDFWAAKISKQELALFWNVMLPYYNSSKLCEIHNKACWLITDGKLLIGFWVLSSLMNFIWI